MRRMLKTLLGVAGVALAAQAAAQVTLYSNEGLRGRTFTADGTIQNLDGTGFNDRAQSAIVQQGRWEACEDAYFAGRCVVLRPGSYGSLGAMGMSRRISSIRPVGDYGYYSNEAPAGYRRQSDEQLYQVRVSSVHAVVGPPEQRCWV